MPTTIFAMSNTSIGKTIDGKRVAAEFHVDLAQQQATGRTIDHHPIEVGALEFAAMGTVWWKGDRRDNPSQGGQCLEVLLDVVHPTAPWTVEDIASLHAIWSRWHLNGMKAGCIHQTEIVYDDSRGYRAVNLDATTAANTCPEGYKYGHAWLYEPLPADVVQELRRLAHLGSTDALIAARGYDLAGKAVQRDADCYSDHNEDIRTKGSCDYCAGTLPMDHKGTVVGC